MKRRIFFGVLALLAGAGSAHGQEQAQGDLPPPGYGTLKQDDIAVTIQMEDMEIRLIPLDERVLRLLSPDAYASLHGILVSRGPDIDAVSRRNGVTAPGVLFVTFFARRSGARYDPGNINVSIRNQLYRPIGMVPYSDNFNAQQLELRQQASGLILFEAQLPVFEPFGMSYGAFSQGWESRLQRVHRERARVMGKVPRDSTQGTQ
jgi:hypothetical protein